MRVQMLLTDGFGGFGGISRFNRDFLSALNGCPLVERVHALPRIIPEAIEEPIPEAVVYERQAARGTSRCGDMRAHQSAASSLDRCQAGAGAFGARHPRLRGLDAIPAQIIESAGQ